MSMNNRERFIATMEYQKTDRLPSWEIAAWPQTFERWKAEGAPVEKMHWNWLENDGFFDLDHRVFIPVNFGMVPPYESKVLEKTDRYEIIQHSNGMVTKALIEDTVAGGRVCMDQYLRFPVESLEDFRDLKKRYVAALDQRYPANWKEELLPDWKNRDYVLVLGHNTAAAGFYWRAREWMGTENLSYAWYDMPDLMHEMMEFYADFTMETAKPILEKIAPDYFVLNEDMAMKNGPLLSPATFKEFIYPHMKRLVEFFKSYGTKYVALDCDGNPEALIPLFMDAGIDILWPLERAADQDPVRLRKEFGRDLRLWGGVDKRELAKGKDAIDAHLAALRPVIDDGGYIPTVDHAVPPDVSWENFKYYMEQKCKLIRGEL